MNNSGWAEAGRTRADDDVDAVARSVVIYGLGDVGGDVTPQRLQGPVRVQGRQD
ncbi:Hypothetical predicted protein, partial [Olea europaea subsp. europaea]